MTAFATSRLIEAHDWSRSREVLWYKCANSGMLHQELEMHIDNDRNAVCLRVQVQPGAQSPPASCHVGHRSCFYRAVAPGCGPSQISNLT